MILPGILALSMVVVLVFFNRSQGDNFQDETPVKTDQSKTLPQDENFVEIDSMLPDHLHSDNSDESYQESFDKIYDR